MLYSATGLAMSSSGFVTGKRRVGGDADCDGCNLHHPGAVPQQKTRRRWVAGGDQGRRLRSPESSPFIHRSRETMPLDRRIELSPDEMRALGHRVVDLMVDHVASLPGQPVAGTASRAEMEARL